MIVVAYLINQLRNSGPVNVLYNLVSNIDCEKFKPIIIKLMQDDADKSVTYKFRELGLDIIEFNYSFWDLELKTSKVANDIKEKLQLYDAKIIHSHGYHPLLVSSYIKSNIIKLDTQHCFSLDSFRSSRGYIIGTYMHYRYMHRLKKISGGISISNSVKEFYQKKNIGIPFHSIYNGIDMSDFSICGNDKMYWKKKIGLEKVDTLFVVVGHLSKLKDPLLVIKSYISLINKGYVKKSALVFCGSGTEEAECKKLANSYPQIIFKGYVFNVSDYLKAADFSICASHSEGFGLNYIEALSAGAIVISSKIPAFDEFVKIYPELKKYQFNVGNQCELERCMQIVNKENGDVDITNIQKDVVERFSSEIMGVNHMNLYNKFLEV